jgi:hypothetical protein
VPVTVDAVTDAIATLPPVVCVGEPTAETQVALTCAAVAVDALKVPLGGFGSQG